MAYRKSFKRRGRRRRTKPQRNYYVSRGGGRL